MLLLWLLFEWDPIKSYLTEITLGVVTTGIAYFVAHILFSRVVISSQGIWQIAKNLREKNPFTTSSSILINEDDLLGWGSAGFYQGIFYIASAKVEKQHSTSITTLHVFVPRWNAIKFQRAMAELDSEIYILERNAFSDKEEVMESVSVLRQPKLILHRDTEEKIEGSIEGFRQRYLRFRQPQSMGLLFTGDPGTGKSTVPDLITQHLIKMSTEFGINNFDMYDVPAQIIRISGQTAKDCANKTNALYYSQKRVVVFEDIDRIDFSNGLPSLLSAIDYLHKSAYLSVVIFTSNSMNIPEVLTRSGRIDEVIFFHLLDRDMAYRMAMSVWPEHESAESFSELVEFMVGKSPSMMDHICRMHINPELGLVAARKMIDDRNFAKSYYDKNSAGDLGGAKSPRRKNRLNLHKNREATADAPAPADSSTSSAADSTGAKGTVTPAWE